MTGVGTPAPPVAPQSPVSGDPPTVRGVVGPAAAVASVVALLAWAALVAGANRWGTALLADGVDLVLPTPPVLGGPGGGLRWPLLLPVAVGGVLVWLLPVAARRLSWRALLVAVVVAGVAWPVALAVAEPFTPFVTGPDDLGTSGLVRGPSWATEYGADVPVVADDPGGFLERFPDDIERYQIHVRGHPPGMVLLLAGLERAGLGGAGWEAALVITAGALALVAVAVALREVAGEPVARRAVPFLVLAPAALWVATSADALFAGVAAWSAALAVLAMRRDGATAVGYGLGAGLLAGVAVMLSYGMVLLVAVPAVVALVQRLGWRPVVRTAALGALGAAVVVVAFVPFGFWWWDGLAATRHEYEVLPLERPYHFFLVNNLAAWALALGPATAVALARLRDRRVWAVVGGGVLAAVLANLSGLSEGEVERIWLPFAVWVLAAGAALTRTWTESRVWLVVQVAAAVVTSAVVTTQW